MRKLISSIILASACLFSVQAKAALITISANSFGLDTPQASFCPTCAGVFTDSFSGTVAGSLANRLDLIAPGVTMTFTSAGAKFVNGSVSGQFAAPLLSGGPDLNNYLNVFGSPATTETISFTGGARVIGLYIGSLDTYNSITFNLAGGGTQTISGTDIQNAGLGLVASQYPNTGATNANRFVYFTDTTANAITSVVLGSAPSNAFEIASVSVGYGTTGTPGVPEASTWMMMILGFVGIGFAGYRRSGWSFRLV